MRKRQLTLKVLHLSVSLPMVLTVGPTHRGTVSLRVPVSGEARCGQGPQEARALR